MRVTFEELARRRDFAFPLLRRALNLFRVRQRLRLLVRWRQEILVRRVPRHLRRHLLLHKVWHHLLHIHRVLHTEHLLLLQLYLNLLLHQRLLLFEVLTNLFIHLALSLLLQILLVHDNRLVFRCVAVVPLLQRLRQPGLLVELMHLLVNVGFKSRLVKPVVEVLSE